MRRSPRLLEGVSASFAGDMHCADGKGELTCQRASELPSVIGACVVGDHDLPGEVARLLRYMGKVFAEEHDG